MRLTNTTPAMKRAWHAVALSSEVHADPVHVRLLGEDWVLVRLPPPTDPDGERTHLAAFVDRCPHRLAPLSAGRVERGALQCPYHGWCFDAEGTCTEIPSLAVADRVPGRARATAAAGVTERAGLVFLAPEPPLNDLLPFTVADDPSFMHGMLEPTRARVGAGLMVDNFLDVAHFPFVHGATIGTDDAVVVGDVATERQGLSMTVTTVHQFPNHEDTGVKTGDRDLLQERLLTYEYRAPFAVSLRIDYLQTGGCNVLDFIVQPEDDEHSRLYTLLHRNDLGDDPHRLADALAFEQKVLDEDLLLQERYYDRSLPLDLTAEVHVSADRHTVEYRRILAAFVTAAV